MFIGFAFGTLCLLGLARAFTHRRWHGRFHPYRSYAFGGGPGGCGGGPGFGRHHRGYDDAERFGEYDEFRHGASPWGGRGRRAHFRDRGRDFVLSLLSRIDATPAQERAILAAIDEFKGIARGLRDTAHDARADIGRSFAGPEIDDAAFESAAARIDEASTKLRAAVRTTLTTIHAALDDRQRKQVADMIGSRWGL